MPLPHILYPALKLILVNRLQKILYCSENSHPTAKFTNLTDSSDVLSEHSPSQNSPSQPDRLNPNQISLHRVQKNSQICYVSAIALQLARSKQEPAPQLAVEIADILNRDSVLPDATIYPLSLDRIWQNFTVQPIASGWLHLKLNGMGLQEWLNTLIDQLPALMLREPGNSAGTTLDPAIGADFTHSFAVLSTHARCCSLLRSGMQAQLLQLEQPDPNSAAWSLSSSDALTWLDADRHFRCTHLTERHLIAQIVDILDELGCRPTVPPQRLWQLSHRLSQNFQAFHAHCRIFGAIQTDDRALAQARLGLVLITQALLGWMLQNWLHVSPPIEL